MTPKQRHDLEEKVGDQQKVEPEYEPHCFYRLPFFLEVNNLMMGLSRNRNTPVVIQLSFHPVLSLPSIDASR